MPTNQTLHLAIEGMHCAACVNRVSAALRKVSGVAVDQVAVGSADVTYDPQAASPEQIAAAVNRVGFTARTE